MARIFASYGEIYGVIHFAAYKSVRESMTKPLKYYRNNVGSLISLIQAMSDGHLNKLVFSSSCTVYGQPESNPVLEDSKVGSPTSPYGSTKVVCERIISEMGDALEPTVLRYFNPIGAHPSSMIGEMPIGSPTNLVPYMTQAAAGKRDPLVLFGDDYPTADGTCVRDYIHVVDVARAHVLALQSRPTTVNLGLGFGTSVRQIIDRFESVNHVSVPHSVGPRQVGDVPEVWCVADRAHAKLGWSPEFSVDDALRDAWNWQKSIDAR
jgi:UDP-glucose 4-epimerase